MSIEKELTGGLRDYYLFNIDVLEGNWPKTFYMEHEKKEIEKILSIMNNDGEYALNGRKGQVNGIHLRNNCLPSINLTPEEFNKEGRRFKLTPKKVTLELKGG